MSLSIQEASGRNYLYQRYTDNLDKLTKDINSLLQQCNDIKNDTLIKMADVYHGGTTYDFNLHQFVPDDIGGGTSSTIKPNDVNLDKMRPVIQQWCKKIFNEKESDDVCSFLMRKIMKSYNQNVRILQKLNKFVDKVTNGRFISNNARSEKRKEESLHTFPVEMKDTPIVEVSMTVPELNNSDTHSTVSVESVQELSLEIPETLPNPVIGREILHQTYSKNKEQFRLDTAKFFNECNDVWNDTIKEMQQIHAGKLFTYDFANHMFSCDGKGAGKVLINNDIHLDRLQNEVSKWAFQYFQNDAKHVIAFLKGKIKKSYDQKGYILKNLEKFIKKIQDRTFLSQNEKDDKKKPKEILAPIPQYIKPLPRIEKPQKAENIDTPQPPIVKSIPSPKKILATPIVQQRMTNRANSFFYNLLSKIIKFCKSVFKRLFCCKRS